MCPGGPTALRRYGELSGCVAMTVANRPCASTVSGDVARDTAAASASWLRHLEQREHGNALQGEVMPSRLWAMRSRRVIARWRTRLHSWCVKLSWRRADRLAAHEGLKDEHRGAAVQAEEARLGVLDLGVAVLGL